MSATQFQDLDLADENREWDGAAAEQRVREWADATDEPNEKYRNAHLWYDEDKPENYTAHKMLFADVVNGELKAVPRGLIAAAAVLDGARGGVDIPKSDYDPVKAHVAKYYGKMGSTPPWED